MNARQRITIKVGAVAAIVIWLFPPWILRFPGNSEIRYGFALTGPHLPKLGWFLLQPHICWWLLALQTVLLVVMVCTLLVLLRDGR